MGPSPKPKHYRRRLDILYSSNRSLETRNVDYSSRKPRIVVRPVLGSDLFAFSDTMEAANLIRHDLETVLTWDFSLRLQTYSASLFRIIIKSSTTPERGFMIDIFAAINSSKRNEITHIG